MAQSDLQDQVILIVDDDIDLNSVLKEYFQSVGAKVLSAANGKEAIDILKSQKVDAIVSDVRMPEMDGQSLLKWVQTQNKGSQPFFFMTGFSDLTDKTSQEVGVNGIFKKPFNLADLEEAVGKALTANK